AGAERHVRQAPVEGHRADRDGEGRQPQPGDEQPVDQPADDADDQDDRDDRLDRHAAVPHLAGERAAQAEDGGDRQVDLPAHHQQRHRQRDQRDLAEVQQRERQVAAAHEVGRVPGAAEEHRDQQHGDGGLPAHQVSQPAHARPLPSSAVTSSPAATSSPAGTSSTGTPWRAADSSDRCFSARVTRSASSRSTLMASSRRTPVMASCQNELTLSTTSTLPMVVSSSAPSAAPYTVPTPPVIATPPTTTAATTFSSQPCAASATTVPKRASHSTPARPARPPLTR